MRKSGTRKPHGDTTRPARGCSRPKCSARPSTGSVSSRAAARRSRWRSAPDGSPSRSPAHEGGRDPHSRRVGRHDDDAGRSFSLVFLVFNGISNVLTQDRQIAVFENAARHLVPGGRFVIELWRRCAARRVAPCEPRRRRRQVSANLPEPAPLHLAERARLHGAHRGVPPREPARRLVGGGVHRGQPGPRVGLPPLVTSGDEFLETRDRIVEAVGRVAVQQPIHNGCHRVRSPSVGVVELVR